MKFSADLIFSICSVVGIKGTGDFVFSIVTLNCSPLASANIRYRDCSSILYESFAFVPSFFFIVRIVVFTFAVSKISVRLANLFSTHLLLHWSRLFFHLLASKAYCIVLSMAFSASKR